MDLPTVMGGLQIRLVLYNPNLRADNYSFHRHTYTNGVPLYTYIQLFSIEARIVAVNVIFPYISRTHSSHIFISVLFILHVPIYIPVGVRSPQVLPCMVPCRMSAGMAVVWGCGICRGRRNRWEVAQIAPYFKLQGEK